MPTPEHTEVWIDVPGCPQPMRAHVARPQGSGKHAAVLVAHELFGVNPDIRGVLETLAGFGYVAIAPEFYHRAAPPGTWLERDDDGRKRGFAFLHALTRAGAIDDVRAAIDHARGRADCTGAVGMLGFSMGGHIAFLAATQLDLAATAVLYGGWLTGRDIALSQPEPTLTLSPGIAARGGRVLYAVGGKDALIDAAQVAAIDAALTSTGVPHEMVVYRDALHAFFWEGTPTFDRAARDDAWRRLREFFAGALA